MILFLDFTNKTSRVAAVNPRPPSSALRRAGGAVWFSAPSGRSVVTALTAVRKLRAFSGKPTCIVMAQGVRGSVRDVSWSGIRSVVAAANALAFAFGVPVSTVALTGEETEVQIADLVRSAARKAKKGDWAGAAYDAEPTITQPKSGK